jgi:tetraacyldisaccharide 4'-kinase
MFKPPRFWKSINSLSISLYPFSILYSWISKARYSLQRPYRSKCKVICIGNVTLGGSGKTPLAIAIGKLLIARKHKVAYACKNYGGSITAPTRVALSHNATQVIDEAVLLSKVAPTFVAAKRVEAIKAACKVADIVISDDGFQNNSFHKDVSILAVPEDKNFGNRLIFPAGPLREPLEAGLKKADLVFLMNETGTSHTMSRAAIAKGYKGKAFKASPRYILCGPRRKQYIAFCGIANPDSFFKSLEKLRIKLVGKHDYPDHHIYTGKDLSRLFKQAKALKAGLITTEKDLVKLNMNQQKEISCLKLSITISNKEHFAVALE